MPATETYDALVLGSGQAANPLCYTLAGPKSFEDYWRVFPAHRDKWPGPAK